MPHPSKSFRANRPRAFVQSARRSGALRAPWLAATLFAGLVAGTHALGGCSDESGTTSGFDPGSTGTVAQGSTSGPTGSGGDIFQTSSSAGGGSSGSGGAPVNCDGDLTPGTPDWSKALGGAGGEFVFDTTIDAAGNILVTGGFTGTVDFGGGPLTSAAATDIFMLKLDPTGKHLWSKRFGGAESQSAKGIAVDKDGNVFITGFYLGSVNFGGATFTKVNCCYEDIFLAKFDSAGNHIWSKGFGDKDADNVSGVAVDAMGNSVITGYFQSALNFGGGTIAPKTINGALDIYVAKFDSAGNHMWSKSYGDTADQSPLAVKFDSSNNVLITGTSKGTVDFGGGPLTAPGTNEGAFLVKLGPDGSHVWSKIYGDGGARGIALDTGANGDIVVAGDYKGNIDFGGGPLASKANDNAFVARLDSTGKYVWNVSFAAVASHATGVAFDSKGKVVVAGYFSGAVDLGKKPGINSAGGFDGFLVKLDSASCHVWSRGFGNEVYQASEAVAIDGSDNIVLVGNFGGTVDLGGGALMADGDDIFIGKFGP